MRILTHSSIIPCVHRLVKHSFKNTISRATISFLMLNSWMTHIAISLSPSSPSLCIPSSPSPAQRCLARFAPPAFRRVQPDRRRRPYGLPGAGPVGAGGPTGGRLCSAERPALHGAALSAGARARTGGPVGTGTGSPGGISGRQRSAQLGTLNGLRIQATKCDVTSEHKAGMNGTRSWLFTTYQQELLEAVYRVAQRTSHRILGLPAPESKPLDSPES